jgi:hypothetical protein
MVTIASLWLPILLSAAAVFILSSIIHMFLGYHNSDFSRVPNEDEAMDALRKVNIPPGDYVLPHASTSKERNSQEFKDKMNKGPVAFMTVFPSGQMSMGKSLVLWFIYCIIVGIFAAYISTRALSFEQGVNYLPVFKFTGVTAFLGYGLALMQESIWFNKKWSATFKNLFDALIYACFTGGIFGWLWSA